MVGEPGGAATACSNIYGEPGARPGAARTGRPDQYRSKRLWAGHVLSGAGRGWRTAHPHRHRAEWLAEPSTWPETTARLADARPETYLRLRLVIFQNLWLSRRYQIVERNVISLQPTVLYGSSYMRQLWNLPGRQASRVGAGRRAPGGGRGCRGRLQGQSVP